MKHSKKEDATLFLPDSVTGQEIVASKTDGKKKNLKKDGTLGRMLRGVLPVPEDIRLASADPEVVKGVVSYFRKEVAPDVNPHLKVDVLASFQSLIDKDATIPESKKEDLKKLLAGDDLALFLAETFIYAINRFSKSKPEDGQHGYRSLCWSSHSFMQ